jgi:hypothetical protein
MKERTGSADRNAMLHVLIVTYSIAGTSKKGGGRRRETDEIANRTRGEEYAGQSSNVVTLGLPGSHTVGANFEYSVNRRKGMSRNVFLNPLQNNDAVRA